jgi:chemotaxis protein MotB
MAEAARRRVIKKVDGDHGHHGGAWKVAYADFVTAMMALFMVMWLLASTDAQTRKEISNYFRTGVLPNGDLSMNTAAQITPSVIQAAPTPPPKGKETIDDAAIDMRNEMARLAAVDSDLADVIRNVHVEVTDDGILIEIVDEDKGLLFDTASSRLKEPLERFLRVTGPMLAAMKEPIEINGHTDARPFATGARISNWDLSYQRASSARDILVANGLPDDSVVGVFARGSSQPYVKTDPMAAQNRRLSILVRTAKTAAAPPAADP